MLIPQVPASPVSLSTPPDVPKNLGRIESFYQGQSPVTVYYIQDAHTSLEAQKNIASLVEKWVNSGQIKTVLEEGYEGALPTEKVFGRQPQAAREKIGWFLLDQLWIGGAEFAHLKNPKKFRLIGIETAAKYKKNLEAYGEADKNQKWIAEELRDLRREIRERLVKQGGVKVQEWIEYIERWQDGRQDFSAVLNKFRKMEGSSETEFEKNYPVIVKVLALSEKEKNQKEKVRTSDELEAINPTQLFSEFQALTKAAFKSVAGQAGLDSAFDSFEQVLVLQKLNRLELTSQEFIGLAAQARFRSARTKELLGGAGKFDAKPKVFSSLWETRIDRAFAFYEAALERDQASANHILKFIQSNPNERQIALTYGGFHKAGILQVLRQAGISYYCVTPMLSKNDSVHEKIYKERMSANAEETGKAVDAGLKPENYFDALTNNHPAAPKPDLLARIVEKILTAEPDEVSARIALAVKQAGSARHQIKRLLDKAAEAPVSVGFQRFENRYHQVRAEARSKPILLMRATVEEIRTRMEWAGVPKKMANRLSEEILRHVSEGKINSQTQLRDLLNQRKNQLGGSPKAAIQKMEQVFLFDEAELQPKRTPKERMIIRLRELIAMIEEPDLRIKAEAFADAFQAKGKIIEPKMDGVGMFAAYGGKELGAVLSEDFIINYPPAIILEHLIHEGQHVQDEDYLEGYQTARKDFLGINAILQKKPNDLYGDESARLILAPLMRFLEAEWRGYRAGDGYFARIVAQQFGNRQAYLDHVNQLDISAGHKNVTRSIVADLYSRLDEKENPDERKTKTWVLKNFLKFKDDPLMRAISALLLTLAHDELGTAVVPYDRAKDSFQVLDHDRLVEWVEEKWKALEEPPQSPNEPGTSQAELDAPRSEVRSEVRTATATPDQDKTLRQQKLLKQIKRNRRVEKTPAHLSTSNMQRLLNLWREKELFTRLVSEAGTDHFDSERIYQSSVTLGERKLRHILLGVRGKSNLYRELFLIDDIAVGYGGFEVLDKGAQINLSFRLFESAMNKVRSKGLAREIFENRLTAIYNFSGRTAKTFQVDPHQFTQSARALVFYRSLFFHEKNSNPEVEDIMGAYFSGRQIPDKQIDKLRKMSTQPLFLNLETQTDKRSELRTTTANEYDAEIFGVLNDPRFFNEDLELASDFREALEYFRQNVTEIFPQSFEEIATALSIFLNAVERAAANWQIDEAQGEAEREAAQAVRDLRHFMLPYLADLKNKNLEAQRKTELLSLFLSESTATADEDLLNYFISSIEEVPSELQYDLFVEKLRQLKRQSAKDSPYSYGFVTAKGYSDFRQYARDFLKKHPPELEIIAIAGKSGSGKTTFGNKLLKTSPDDFTRMRRTTTRPLRAEEQQKGSPHRHVSETYFKEQTENGFVYLERERHGAWYAYLLEDLLDVIASEKTVLMEGFGAVKDIRALWPKTNAKIIGVLALEYEKGMSDEEFIRRSDEELRQRIARRETSHRKLIEPDFRGLSQAELDHIEARIRDSGNVVKIRDESDEIIWNVTGANLQTLFESVFLPKTKALLEEIRSERALENSRSDQKPIASDTPLELDVPRSEMRSEDFGNLREVEARVSALEKGANESPNEKAAELVRLVSDYSNRVFAYAKQSNQQKKYEGLLERLSQLISVLKAKAEVSQSPQVVKPAVAMKSHPLFGNTLVPNTIETFIKYIGELESEKAKDTYIPLKINSDGQKFLQEMLKLAIATGFGVERTDKEFGPEKIERQAYLVRHPKSKIPYGILYKFKGLTAFFDLVQLTDPDADSIPLSLSHEDSLRHANAVSKEVFKQTVLQSHRLDRLTLKDVSAEKTQWVGEAKRRNGKLGNGILSLFVISEVQQNGPQESVRDIFLRPDSYGSEDFQKFLFAQNQKTPAMFKGKTLAIGGFGTGVDSLLAIQYGAKAIKATELYWMMKVLGELNVSFAKETGQISKDVPVQIDLKDGFPMSSSGDTGIFNLPAIISDESLATFNPGPNAVQLPVNYLPSTGSLFIRESDAKRILTEVAQFLSESQDKQAWIRFERASLGKGDYGTSDFLDTEVYLNKLGLTIAEVIGGKYFLIRSLNFISPQSPNEPGTSQDGLDDRRSEVRMEISESVRALFRTAGVGYRDEQLKSLVGVFKPSFDDILNRLGMIANAFSANKIVDLGSGQGAVVFAFSFMPTKPQVLGIEYDENLFNESQKVRRALKNEAEKNRIRFENGDFNDPKYLTDLEEADMAYYFENGTANEEKLLETVKHLKPGAGLIVLRTSGNFVKLVEQSGYFSADKFHTKDAIAVFRRNEIGKLNRAESRTNSADVRLAIDEEVRENFIPFPGRSIKDSEYAKRRWLETIADRDPEMLSKAHASLDNPEKFMIERAWDTIRTIEPYVEAGETVLDIGSGAKGGLAFILALMGARVTSFEIDSDAVKKLREKYQRLEKLIHDAGGSWEIFEGDFSDPNHRLQLGEKKFAHVVASDVVVPFGSYVKDTLIKTATPTWDEGKVEKIVAAIPQYKSEEMGFLIFGSPVHIDGGIPFVGRIAREISQKNDFKVLGSTPIALPYSWGAREGLIVHFVSRSENRQDSRKVSARSEVRFPETRSETRQLASEKPLVSFTLPKKVHIVQETYPVLSKEDWRKFVPKVFGWAYKDHTTAETHTIEINHTVYQVGGGYGLRFSFPDGDEVTLHDYHNLFYGIFKDFEKRKPLNSGKKVFVHYDEHPDDAEFLPEGFDAKYKQQLINAINQFSQQGTWFVAAQILHIANFLDALSLWRSDWYRIWVSDNRHQSLQSLLFDRGHLLEAFNIKGGDVASFDLDIFSHGFGRMHQNSVLENYRKYKNKLTGQLPNFRLLSFFISDTRYIRSAAALKVFADLMPVIAKTKLKNIRNQASQNQPSSRFETRTAAQLRNVLDAQNFKTDSSPIEAEGQLPVFSNRTEAYYRTKRERIGPQQAHLFAGRRLDGTELALRREEFGKALAQLRPEIFEKIKTGHQLVIGVGDHGQELEMLAKQLPQSQSLSGTDIHWEYLEKEAARRRFEQSLKIGNIPLYLMHSNLTDPEKALKNKKYNAIYANLVFRSDILDSEEWGSALGHLKELLAEDGVVFVRGSSSDDVISSFKDAGFQTYPVEGFYPQNFFISALRQDILPTQRSLPRIASGNNPEARSEARLPTQSGGSEAVPSKTARGEARPNLVFSSTAPGGLKKARSDRDARGPESSLERDVLRSEARMPGQSTAAIFSDANLEGALDTKTKLKNWNEAVTIILDTRVAENLSDEQILEYELMLAENAKAKLVLWSANKAESAEKVSALIKRFKDNFGEARIGFMQHRDRFKNLSTVQVILVGDQSRIGDYAELAASLGARLRKAAYINQEAGIVVTAALLSEDEYRELVQRDQFLTMNSSPEFALWASLLIQNSLLVSRSA